MKKQIKTFLSLSKTEGIIGTLKMVINAFSWSYSKYILKNRFIVKKIHGSKMLLDLKDPGIAMALAIVGTREKEHLYILKKELKEDDNVIDIGANIGYYVLIEKKIVKNGKIFAVEPEPRNFQHLNKNISLNKYQGIETFNMGMSNKKGTAKMYLSSLSNVHTLIPDDVKNQMTGKSIDIEVTTPTQFMQNIKSKINLIRMDIEGYEVEVIEDIIKAIKKDKQNPSILFEIHPKKYSKSHSLKKQLENLFKLGYHFRYMASSNPEQFKKRGYKSEKAIPTDGTIRYIYTNVKNKDALELVSKCRTVMLKAGD